MLKRTHGTPVALGVLLLFFGFRLFKATLFLIGAAAFGIAGFLVSQQMVRSILVGRERSIQGGRGAYREGEGARKRRSEGWG